MNDIIVNQKKWRKRLLISTPTEGLIRYEWAHARFAQVMPVNWEASGFDVDIHALGIIGYSIDDAYNLITSQAINLGVDWLLIIEDDVLIPMDFFVKMSQYMDSGDIPVVSGMYCTKAIPSEPLLFRGRGNGVYRDWVLGDKVWVDGLPMGCLLLHTTILKWFWDNTEKYRLPTGEEVSKVFETPRKIYYDPATGIYQRQEGTQDLYFFDRIIEYDVLKKTGWESKEYPFLCDTSIFCKHIDRNTGKQYPLVMGDLNVNRTDDTRKRAINI